MRKILQYLLKRPLLWFANRFSAAPHRDVVFKSLSDLYSLCCVDTGAKLSMITADAKDAKFIVFSDQHKGDKSWGDDFKTNESNYLAALHYYHQQGYTLISLGDSEELWKFRAEAILPANEKALAAEAAFQPDRFYKTFGNHDIIWKNKLDVIFLLKKYFTMPLAIYEGLVIKLKTASSTLDIFLTHGHQGDNMSDNNAFSTWVVAHIWMPLQRYLRININSPSKDYSLRNKHNIMMSDWSSAQKNLILITGHTHVPVFASGRYYNHPSNKIAGKENETLKPSYFNCGCCCYDDGDITGIEIQGGYIRLVKWYDEEVAAKRMILEERSITEILEDLK